MALASIDLVMVVTSAARHRHSQPFVTPDSKNVHAIDLNVMAITPGTSCPLTILHERLAASDNTTASRLGLRGLAR
jgi:hypothetical protein